ncbi:MAG: hypothetical protein ABRQ37_06405 [Candidatus Eremiobacterota bacterium]
MNKQILTPPAPQEIRKEIEDLITGELYGPAGGPQEELNESNVHTDLSINL